MKLNKTLALAALVAGSLFAGSIAVQAQDSATTPPADGSVPKAHGNGMNIKHLTKELDLTPDEVTNVQAALDDQKQQIKDMHADTSLSDTDKRAKMKEIRTAFTAKMKTILTSEQFTKFEKASAGHRRPMPTPPADATTTNAPSA